MIEHVLNERSDEMHQIFFRATGGDGCCAKAQARGEERTARVERHHVFVGCDVGRNQRFLCHLTRELGIFAAQIHQHRVVVGSPTDDGEATLYKVGSQCCRIVFHLLCIGLPRGEQVFAKAHSLSSDDMFERAALCAWENGRIEQGAHHFHFAFLGGQPPGILKIFAHKNDSATRTTQCFVGGAGDDVGIF